MANVLCEWSRTGGSRGDGEVEGATYLGFLHLGGLLLPRLSGCGKWKMKGAAFPASRVTMSKAEKGGWGKKKRREKGGDWDATGKPGLGNGPGRLGQGRGRLGLSRSCFTSRQG